MNFTPKELDFVNNQDFLITKRALIDKIYHEFGNIGRSLQKQLVIDDRLISESFIERPGKISRGENYHGLPYLMLDFPRNFRPESTLAYRLMFWWGNFFSATLQLSGSVLEQNQNQLVKHIDKLRDKDIFFCVNSSPWEYHLNENNYLHFDEININQILKQVKTHKFVKLNKILPLERASDLESFAIETFKDYLRILRRS